MTLREKEILENPFYGLQATVFQRRKPALPPITKSKMDDNRPPIRVSKRTKHLKKIPVVFNRGRQGTSTGLPRTPESGAKPHDDVMVIETMETSLTNIHKTENTSNGRLVAINNDVKLNDKMISSVDNYSSWPKPSPRSLMRTNQVHIIKQQLEFQDEQIYANKKTYKTTKLNSFQSEQRISEKRVHVDDIQQSKSTPITYNQLHDIHGVEPSPRPPIHSQTTIAPLCEQNLLPRKGRCFYENTRINTGSRSNAESVGVECRLLTKRTTKVSREIACSKAGIPRKPRLHRVHIS